MKVLLKPTSQPPKVVEIDNTLEALQAAVGGDIETVTLTTDVCILCYQFGKLEGWPFNCRLCGAIFHGPILVVGVKGDEFTDLKDPENVAKFLFGDSNA